jgi:hypothetical protein
MSRSIVIALVCLVGFPAAGEEPAPPVDNDGAQVVEDPAEFPWWPLILVKTGVGLPLLVNLRVEAFVLERWTVEAGVSTGLIPTSFTLGGRWRPRALCIGCDGDLRLSTGLGVEATAFVQDGNGALALPDEGMALFSVDALLAARVFRRLGASLGARLGGGAALGVSGDGPKVEPAVLLLFEAGVVF